MGFGDEFHVSLLTVEKNINNTKTNKTKTIETKPKSPKIPKSTKKPKKLTTNLKCFILDRQQRHTLAGRRGPLQKACSQCLHLLLQLDGALEGGGACVCVCVFAYVCGSLCLPVCVSVNL